MRRKVFCILLGLALAFPAMAAWAAEEIDDRPLTKQETAEFQSELSKAKGELDAYVASQGKREAGKASPTKFHKGFKVKKKSSSPTRAVRRARKAMQALMEGYYKELVSKGWIPLQKPKPIVKYKVKTGIHKFKFYCRITASLTVWCVKKK